MQTIYLGNGKILKVVRSFVSAPNKWHVMETESGDFCYPGGDLVFDRSHLIHLPKGPKERAFKWFDEKYGEKTRKVEPTGNAAVDMPVVKTEDQDEGIEEITGLREELEHI